MREYLFRGKKISNGEWIYGFLFITDVGYFIGPYNEEDQVIPETIGEYIGWRDRENGRVFTGDKIEIFWQNDKTIEVISYDQYYGYFKYGNNPICELRDNPLIEINIVGNIHESLL